MSAFNTGNLVPSMDPRDLDDNATVFDLLVTSSEDFVPDRLGILRRTWHRMEEDAEALIAPNVSSLAALNGLANKGLYFTGADTLALYDLSPLVRDFSAATTQAAARGVIGALAASDTSAYAGSAAKLTTARSIAASGDATWSVNFDGSANVTAALTLANSGVAAGTYGSVTVNAKGLVTSASAVTPIANGGTGSATGGEAMTNLTLANSWTVIASRRAVYRKVLDMVQLEVQIIGGTATDGTAICTALPVGFRPAATIAIPVQSGPNTTPSSSVASQRVVIGTDGSIVCQNCSSAPGISFVAMFPTV